jgi:hypothetical protein
MNMKYAALRPFADPEKAARKLIEIANATEAVQDGRIHIEKINSQFCSRKTDHRRSTSPGSTTPLPRAGFGSTSPALM